MVVAWLMVGLGKTFALDTVGAWAIENLVYFFVGALAIALLGAGRYSLAGQSAAVKCLIRLGRKVDTVGDLQFFSPGKRLSHVA